MLFVEIYMVFESVFLYDVHENQNWREVFQ